MDLFLLGGNIIALVGGFAALVGWFRRWLVKQVSEPVQQLTSRVEQNHLLATRAHDRLDRHLESHNG